MKAWIIFAYLALLLCGFIIGWCSNQFIPEEKHILIEQDGENIIIYGLTDEPVKLEVK